jgi:hypothetical protein
MTTAPPVSTGDPNATHALLAVVTRGGAVDSLHMGSVAIVDRHGRLLHSAGDPAFPTMTRSTLKPFQAMPFVAADWFEPVIRNYRGIATGRVLSSVVLDKSSADMSRRAAGPQ